MKKLNQFLFISLLLSTKLFAQDFIIIKSPADSLREIGDMPNALIEFQKIYQKDATDQNNIYNYSCALSIMGKNDSAFFYLRKAVSMDSSTTALTDPDFLKLRQDKRWEDFENFVIQLYELKDGKPIKDKEYAKKLWKMLAKDQAYYDDLKIVETKIGKQSTVAKTLWVLKSIYNEENLKELESLIAKRGWPKSTEVGGRAAGAAFLIIQHNTSEKQKQYLPVIEKLCKEKEAKWSSYALMYDRIQTSEDKPQKYGSQVKYNFETKKYELFPLLDATKVDEWRKEVGLGKLADYVKSWDIIFEPSK